MTKQNNTAANPFIETIDSISKIFGFCDIETVETPTVKPTNDISIVNEFDRDTLLQMKRIDMKEYAKDKLETIYDSIQRAFLNFKDEIKVFISVIDLNESQQEELKQIIVKHLTKNKFKVRAETTPVFVVDVSWN